VVEDGEDGLFGEVGGDVGALEAEANVAVVDTAGVDGPPGVVAADEDGDLGGDVGVGEGDEITGGVEAGEAGGVELGLMLVDGGGGFGGVGIDVPDANSLGGVEATQALDFREGAVGDGAVGGEEEEDEDAVGGLRQGRAEAARRLLGVADEGQKEDGGENEGLAQHTACYAAVWRVAKIVV
jgi:hypothetical protein